MHAQGSSWESIHVVQVQPEEGTNATAKRAQYKLSTTVMLSVDYGAAAAGDTNLSGSLATAAQQSLPYASSEDHLVNIGRMIEKMENDMRSNIDGTAVAATTEQTAS